MKYNDFKNLNLQESNPRSIDNIQSDLLDAINDNIIDKDELISALIKHNTFKISKHAIRNAIDSGKLDDDYFISAELDYMTPNQINTMLRASNIDLNGELTESLIDKTDIRKDIFTAINNGIVEKFDIMRLMLEYLSSADVENLLYDNDIGLKDGVDKTRVISSLSNSEDFNFDIVHVLYTAIDKGTIDEDCLFHAIIHSLTPDTIEMMLQQHNIIIN